MHINNIIKSSLYPINKVDQYTFIIINLSQVATLSLILQNKSSIKLKNKALLNCDIAEYSLI